MKKKTFVIILCSLLFSPCIFSQESTTIPEALRRPERSEALRYPKDIVIGELGRGKAPEEAYQYASRLVAILAAGSKDSSILNDFSAILTDSLLEGINNLEPRSYRLGGGRIEPDGSVSFLVRFLGNEDSMTGELFLHSEETPAPKRIPGPEEPADSLESGPEQASSEAGVSGEAIVSEEAAVPARGKWILDDLILEEKRPLIEIKDSYRYDFTPYERFY